MENDQKRFDDLIEKLNQIINSGALNEEEIYKFYRYVDVLSNNVFNYEEKYRHSIIIEEQISKYRDIVSIYGDKPKSPSK